MMKKNILFFFMIGLLFLSFLIPVSASGMSEEQVKAGGKKGDIYNPQTNSIGDSVLVNAFHYADGKTYSNGDVEVQKIVSKTNVEGKYNVEFKIRGKNAKEGVVTTNPVYVVVVLDRSNSMRHDNKWTNAIAGAKSFATTLFQSIPTAQLALVEFSGKTDNTNWSDAEIIRNFENKNFDNTDFGSYGKNGGATNLGEGLRYAYHLLNGSNVPDNAYKYVVVLSDGEPTLYTDSDGNSDGDAYNYDKTAHEYATTWANNLKNTLEAQIFTIGYEITSGGKAEMVLKGIADASSYYVDADTSDIVSKFKNVSSSFDVEYNAGSSVTIVDQLGSAFTLGDGSTTLTLDTIVESWTSLGSFDIMIDPDSSNGWYPTNDGFRVTYQDHKGVLKEFSCEDDPEVLWEQDEYEYTVRYHFNNHLDQSFTQILSGVFQNIVYAKDYYLEYINSNGLSDKNQTDQTYYFLDPDNDSNFSDITVSSNPDDNVLNLYYIDTDFENEMIDKSTDVDVIDDSDMLVDYVIDYYVDVTHIREGDELVTVITDRLPYEIDVEKSHLNGGNYDPENKTITWTFEDQVDTYQDIYSISKQIEYGVVYLNFADVSATEDNELINYASGYTKVNDKISNGVEDDASVEVLIEGNVKAIYVEDGNLEHKLADDSNFTGLVGESYHTSSKEIFGYTLVEEKYPTNEEGVFTEEDIVVTYVYIKNDGDITHSVDKSGSESVTSISDVFDYQILVDASIKNYVGDVILKVVDTLSYPLDESKSVLDDRCKYDGNLEIVCEIDYGSIYEEDYEVNELGEKEFFVQENFEFQLVFVDVDSDSVVNHASSEIILDHNSDVKVDEVTTSIPMGTVIVNYVTKDNEVLADRIVMNGLSGDLYETVKKEFVDYYFIELIGDAKGVFQNGVIEVTYVYDVTPLPPHTGLGDHYFTNGLKYILCFGIFFIFAFLFRKVIVLKK